jgi:hypothetical protein
MLFMLHNPVMNDILIIFLTHAIGVYSLLQR